MKHKRPMQVKTASPRSNIVQYVRHKGVAGTTSPPSFGGRTQKQKRRGGGGGGGKDNAWNGNNNDSSPTTTTTAPKRTVLSGLTLRVLLGEEETLPLTMSAPRRPTTSSGLEKSRTSNWVKMTHGGRRFCHQLGDEKHIIERGIDRLTNVMRQSVIKGGGKEHQGSGGGLNTTRW